MFIKKCFVTGKNKCIIRLQKYPIHLVWKIQVRKHVYIMKTFLFQYKTIRSEHMFTSLILPFLVGAQVNMN